MYDNLSKSVIDGHFRQSILGPSKLLQRPNWVDGYIWLPGIFAKKEWLTLKQRVGYFLLLLPCGGFQNAMQPKIRPFVSEAERERERDRRGGVASLTSGVSIQSHYGAPGTPIVGPSVNNQVKTDNMKIIQECREKQPVQSSVSYLI